MWERQVQIAGDPSLNAAIDPDAGNIPPQPMQQPTAQRPDPFGVCHQFIGRQTAGLSQADDQRRRQRAGTQSPLLPATRKQRRQPDARAAADEQRPNPLRAIEFMAADGRKIDFPTGQVERDFSQRLRQIGVEQSARLFRDRRQTCEVLNYAGLVIHRHHANQQRGRRQRLPQYLGIEQPVGANRQDKRLEPLGRQIRH